MTLYHLTTGHYPSKAYAVRAGTHQDEPVIAWVQRKGAAALFKKSDALKLARRMRKVVRVKLEVAA
jgi:hypothetical protein